MGIKLDENVDARLAMLLKKAGHDTNTIQEQNLHGTEDKALYDICKVDETVSWSVLTWIFPTCSAFLLKEPRGLLCYEDRTISFPPCGFWWRP